MIRWIAAWSDEGVLTFDCKLTVSGDLRFLSMVQSWGREISALANLQPRDGLTLELAVEEGFANAVQHAYPGSAPGPVHLAAWVDGQILTLSIRDEGVPYNPLLMPARPVDEETFRGMGLDLIKQVVDEVSFLNHGRGGKELRLTRYLLDSVAAPPEQALEEVTLAPKQTYEVRRMVADDAAQVARVFWLAYGYSYKNDAFYQPEGLLPLLGSGQLISFVAVAENGEVVGHAGLVRPVATPTAEAALLVVSPAHRGRGLMERLGEMLLNAAQDLELYGVHSNAATSHAISQRETVRSGGIPCGLDLAACPPCLFKTMKKVGEVPQRETYLCCYRTLRAEPPAAACVPTRHRALVGEIYEALGRTVTFVEASDPVTAACFSVTLDRGHSKGLVRVDTSNPEGWIEMLRAAKDLIALGGAEVVSLDLPLAQPSTARLWELAEAAGFFFAGIRPHEAADGDAVRLQRLAIPYDVTRLRIYPKFARRLTAYVADEMLRADAIPFVTTG